MDTPQFTILGGGAFSLALATVLANKNIPSLLLVRDEHAADSINRFHFHPKYLKDYVLSEKIFATTNPSIGFKNAKYLIHAIPMQASRTYLTNVRHYISSDTPIISVTKGIEQGTSALMSDIFCDVFGNDQKVAFLSGPSFAQEIVERKATAVVVAAFDRQLASEISEIFSSIDFRCHTSTDVKGIELSGALKNVLAIAAGMCEGLGLGMNAMSSLVTRGCKEMANMGTLFGAEERTFFGLAGVGDAFGTCIGPLSRNRLDLHSELQIVAFAYQLLSRKVGYRLAQGEKLDDILVTLEGIPEGVFTVMALEALIKAKIRDSIYDFKFPILSGVARIINGTLTPAQGLEMLMKYPLYFE